MRKLWLTIVIVALVIVMGIYLWTRSAQSRFVAEMDKARQEVEKMAGDDFARAALFKSSLSAALGAGDGPPDDAMTYYRKAQQEAATLQDQDLTQLIHWVEDLQAPTPEEDPNQMLAKYSQAVDSVEVAIGQPKCGLWASPLQGLEFEGPSLKIHRGLAYLFLLRASQQEEADNLDGALKDFLRAAIYTQDLGRWTSIRVRLCMSRLHTIALQKLQLSLAQRSVSKDILLQISTALNTMEQIEPPPSQTLDFEQWLQMSAFEQQGHSVDGTTGQDLLLGSFGVLSTYQRTSATMELSRILGSAKKLVNLVPGDAAPGGAKDQTVLVALGQVDAQLQQSSNPWVSALTLNLRAFQIATAEVVRARRMALIIAALQIHRIDNGAFPDSLGQVRNDILRAMPVDPFTKAPFQYQPPDVKSTATLAGVVVPDAIAEQQVDIYPTSIHAPVEAPSETSTDIPPNLQAPAEGAPEGNP